MQDKHDMPLITADDTVEDIIEEKFYIFSSFADNIVPGKPDDDWKRDSVSAQRHHGPRGRRRPQLRCEFAKGFFVLMFF